MNTVLFKEQYEKLKNSKNKEFLLLYSLFSEQCVFLSKIIKESKNQNLIICDSISETKKVFNIIKKYIPQEKISISHKNLSKTELYNSWKNIADNKVKLVIGTKTSIFSPFFNLENIIIINEEAKDHKQYDMNPRYSVKEIAEYLSKSNNINLIYTSKAPSIETFSKNLEILNIKENINNSKISIINKNIDLEIIPNLLESLIQENNKNKEKTILINNNKNFSSSIFCGSCGNVEKCEKCKVPFKYDKKINKAKCNICGQEKNIPESCPRCKNTEIKYYGIGNQKLEDELNKKFPNLKTLIIDAEIIKPLSSLEKHNIINEINNSDIIIGTEFLVKNYLYYIKNINTLSIFSIDNYINLPDFKSNELLYQYIRTFIELSKEKNIKNLVFITKYTNNQILNLAINDKYAEFYETEFNNRKILGYPPIEKLVKLIIKDKKETELEKKYIKLKEILEKNEIETIGEKEVNKNQKNIIVKIPNNKENILQELGNFCLLDINPEFLTK